MSSSQTFWATVAAYGLRREGPSWPRKNLRTPVSLACFWVPGTPDRREQAEDDSPGGEK